MVANFGPVAELCRSFSRELYAKGELGAAQKIGI